MKEYDGRLMRVASMSGADITDFSNADFKAFVSGTSKMEIRDASSAANWLQSLSEKSKDRVIRIGNYVLKPYW